MGGWVGGEWHDKKDPPTNRTAGERERRKRHKSDHPQCCSSITRGDTTSQRYVVLLSECVRVKSARALVLDSPSADANQA